MFRSLALISLVVVLGLVNWSIAGKEKHLAGGRIVYLELAPVDPRSLMQGDYMALRFRLANAVYDTLPKSSKSSGWRHHVDASDGYLIAGLDERKIGSFKRLSNDRPSSNDEVLMRYRVRNGEVKFATNAFFFQEGHSQYYQTARYGQFRVDDKGELLLIGLYDKDLKKLGKKEK